jgi:prolyl 4-hydroxylase
MIEEFVNKLSTNEKYIGLAVITLCIISIIMVTLYFFFWKKQAPPVIAKEIDDKWSSKETQGDDNSTVDMRISEIEEPKPKGVNLKITPHEFGEYTIFEIRDVLTAQQCDELIALGKAKGMDESAVLSYGTDSTTEMDKSHRKSKHTWLKDEESQIIQEIAEYTGMLSSLPIENQEMIQIASYEPGGMFNPHYDACVYEDKEYCDKINKGAGQRKLTLLIYLNDDFEGGETEFTTLNLKIKPEKGKAILFASTDDKQVIYKESMHQGNEVLSGEKWIATKWVHFGKFAD